MDFEKKNTFSDLATFNKLNLGLVHLPKSNICTVFFLFILRRFSGSPQKNLILNFLEVSNWSSELKAKSQLHFKNQKQIKLENKFVEVQGKKQKIEQSK